MITEAFAENFGNNWINYWNNHDMDKILSLYADDFIIESPKALNVVQESNGIVSGKENVKRYWLAAMQKCRVYNFKCSGYLLVLMAFLYIT